MEAKLDRDKILQALSMLDAELCLQEVIGEICIFGGAAMLLGFDGGIVTRDVDAVFVPKARVNNAVLKIAEALDLPASWLNDGVKGFLSEKEDFTEEGMPQFNNLRVIRPSARYLLAMKCMASRVTGYGQRGDAQDIKRLCEHLTITSINEVLDIVSEYYPVTQILPKSRYFVEEILQEVNE